MLRISIIAALVVLSTPVFAEEVKGIKFEFGCIGPITKFAGGIGTCVIADTKSRTWCPIGQILRPTGRTTRGFFGSIDLQSESNSVGISKSRSLRGWLALCSGPDALHVCP